MLFCKGLICAKHTHTHTNIGMHMHMQRHTIIIYRGIYISECLSFVLPGAVFLIPCTFLQTILFCRFQEALLFWFRLFFGNICMLLQSARFEMNNVAIGIPTTGGTSEIELMELIPFMAWNVKSCFSLLQRSRGLGSDLVKFYKFSLCQLRGRWIRRVKHKQTEPVS